MMLIILLATLTVVSIPMTHVMAGQMSGDVVALTSPYGNDSLELPWDPGRRVDIQGSIGAVVLEATDEGIRVVSSSCGDQLCLEVGVLSAANPIVCAPNGVAAFLVDSQGGFDAVSR